MDDVLLTYGSKDSILHIMKCLSVFSNLNRLSPNIHKSTVFFSNCDAEVMTWLDNLYGIPHGQLPVKFLGVPLISSKLSINDCMLLIAKLTNRLNAWTSRLLSFAGRMQLIRAVLFPIQAYWSAHFILLGAIHKIMQKLFTRFLWK